MTNPPINAPLGPPYPGAGEGWEPSEEHPLPVPRSRMEKIAGALQKIIDDANEELGHEVTGYTSLSHEQIEAAGREGPQVREGDGAIIFRDRKARERMGS